MVAEPSREFIVIVLGRTIDEWRGREESRHATGRAGFNAFGTPEDLLERLEGLFGQQRETNNNSGGRTFAFIRREFSEATALRVVLVDVCQPRKDVVEEWPREEEESSSSDEKGGRRRRRMAIFLDARRLDFNSVEDLRELPQAHLILHDRRTLQIFAFGPACAFLTKRRLLREKEERQAEEELDDDGAGGAFLIHGLKADALYDSDNNNDGDKGVTGAKALRPPNFAVDVVVSLAAAAAASAANTMAVRVPCHLDDSLLDLRRRMLGLRERWPWSLSSSSASSSSSPASESGCRGVAPWEVPVGFQKKGGTSSSSSSSQWLPFRHPTLRSFLRLPPTLDKKHDFADDGGGGSPIPTLRESGSAAIPLRRRFLERLLEVEEEAEAADSEEWEDDVEDTAAATRGDEGHGEGGSSDSSDGSKSSKRRRKRRIVMRRHTAWRCPLTDSEGGLVSLTCVSHSHSS